MMPDPSSRHPFPRDREYANGKAAATTARQPGQHGGQPARP